MVHLILLQEVGIPLASLILTILGGVVTLSGFLIRDAYLSLKENIKLLENNQKKHEDEDIIKHASFETKLNDTNIKILQEINAISLKLAEFKNNS